ncbi:hypothetical protein [Maritalea sp.]|uniref:hypothetical protein n=1 Tax=Maritalea sp. TaxID=2003361 RepID=UPI003EF86F10
MAQKEMTTAKTNVKANLNKYMIYKGKMVNRGRETSNTILETLEEWNDYLKTEDVNLDSVNSKPENQQQARPRIQREGPSL